MFIAPKKRRDASSSFPSAYIRAGFLAHRANGKVVTCVLAGEDDARRR